jgi:hypothetical protein
MGRRLGLVAALVLALLSAACGNERQRADKLPPPASPSGRDTQSFAAQGVSFQRPENWLLSRGELPQLAAVSSGRAAIVLWRYSRRERLPRSARELGRARRALLAAAKARDKTIRVLSSRALRAGGSPAVEVVATERIGAQRRRVRSTHVYAHGAELVIDAYAPPADFPRVDRTVFRPLVESLRLRPPPHVPRS